MAGSCLATVAFQQCLSFGGRAFATGVRKDECRMNGQPALLSTGRRCNQKSSCLADRYLSEKSSQRLRISCSLRSSDESTTSDSVKLTQESLIRMAVVPMLAFAIFAGAAVPSQAEGMIDWGTLLEAPQTETAAPVADEPAEAPSYKDLLQKLKNTVAPPEVEEEAQAPEAPAAPAPLSLLERQQKRAAELAERAAKQAAERKAAAEKLAAERAEAARAMMEKREAEEARKAAEKAAKEEAKLAQQAQLAAKREAEEQEKAAAKAAAAAAKAPAKSAPVVSSPVSGKKATHGYMPLFFAQFLFFMAYAGGITVLFFVSEEQLEKVKKPLEELVEKAKPLVASAQPAVVSALEKGQELAIAAVPAVEKAFETAKPLAAQAWEASKPVAAQALEASKPLVKQAQEKAKELVNQAKEQVSKSG